ncbi:MAG: UDP-2,3-diacylglucosamine diphosphatase [Acidobacteriota bacterium]
MRTIVLGDVHLGSKLCRCGCLLRVLASARWDRLVLNGDIFDDLNFRRLNRNHWKILELLRDLGKDREVVWIRGNHDGSAGLLGHLLGVRVYEEFLFDYKGGKVYVVHGDQFDTFQKSARKVRSLRDLFYGFAIWFDVPRKTAIQWVQRSSYVFERAARRVKEAAVARGIELGASFVVAGHTHRREVERTEGVLFLNPSSWLTSTPAYALFDEDEPAPRLITVRAVRPSLLKRALARTSLSKRRVPDRGPGTCEGLD